MKTLSQAAEAPAPSDDHPCVRSRVKAWTVAMSHCKDPQGLLSKMASQPACWLTQVSNSTEAQGINARVTTQTHHHCSRYTVVTDTEGRVTEKEAVRIYAGCLHSVPVKPGPMAWAKMYSAERRDSCPAERRDPCPAKLHLSVVRSLVSIPFPLP